MVLINCDVTVLIAEHVDIDSMVPLMLCSKTIYQLVRGHERSIVKTKIAQLVHDPMFRPPLGALLSSYAPDQPGLGRKILEPMSFAVAKELESRDRRINRLFSSGCTSLRGYPLVETMKRLVLFQNIPSCQMERLIDGFKDACRVADRIADCAVIVHLEPKPTTGHLQNEESAIQHEIHLARQRYIRSLSPIRLAFLTLLASVTGMQFAQELPVSDSDPLCWERVIAFKETFLRHGTVVVCALLCPSDSETTTTSSSARTGNSAACHLPYARSDTARYYMSQVDEVLMELLEYEKGQWDSLRHAEHGADARPIPDSLHMTMLQAFPGPEEAEEMDQPPEDIGVEEEDADGNWLFNIDVLDYDKDHGDDNSSTESLIKPDPRESLILKWIMQR
ncbi:hypothetical protein NEMBOFW57_001231 [Staphylotrichum longicolle]|uniref:Uncharacterized protein n=1 Tax=Staphylotrichum longicolle TaxID=669026 RepID=A0AAD4F1N8_9PEZI|nr:hypothetical protein NEMBOFW57_001231 [Staphylotrichum longicolle]